MYKYTHARAPNAHALTQNERNGASEALLTPHCLPTDSEENPASSFLS